MFPQFQFYQRQTIEHFEDCGKLSFPFVFVYDDPLWCARIYAFVLAWPFMWLWHNLIELSWRIRFRIYQRWFRVRQKVIMVNGYSELIWYPWPEHEAFQRGQKITCHMMVVFLWRRLKRVLNDLF